MKDDFTLEEWSLNADDVEVPLPRAIDAELAILGVLMAAGGRCDAVEELEPRDFFAKAHQAVFKAMRALVDAGKPIDLILLSDELRRAGLLDAVGGLPFLSTLDTSPEPANLPHYVGQVKETARLRATILTSERLRQEARQGARLAADLAAEYADRLQGLITVSSSAKPVRLGDLLTPGMEELERSQRSGGVTGLATGFVRLDDLTAGLQPGDLILLAARPSQGKTALAMNIAREVGRKETVLVCSMEMSKHQLFLRMLSSEARVDSHRMRAGWLRDEDWPKLAGAMGTLADAKIFIDDQPSLTVREVRRRAKAIRDEHGLALLVIDYLQLMKGKGENRTQEVSSISHDLKALAKELNVPIVALSQLSRASESSGARKARRPQLSDLRESGDLEADADLVVMIYRATKDDDAEDDAVLAELLVRKQRNGPLGTVKVVWSKECVRFDNPKE